MKTIMGLIVLAMMAAPVALTAEKPAAPAAQTATATQSPAAEQDPLMAIQLPAKGTGEYWDLRSHAVTELTAFITKKRAEFREKIDSATRFLAEKGLALQYKQANIKLPDDPAIYAKVLGLKRELPPEVTKNLTAEKMIQWETLIDLSMRYIANEGYDPAQTTDDKEIGYLKTSCENKEKFAQKARKEMRDQVNKLVTFWIFLGTEDKRQAMADFFVAEQLQKKEAEAARMQQGRDAMREQERARREEQAKIRQQRLNDRYNDRFYYY